MSRITYVDVYDATTACLKERIRLRQVDHSNTLLKHHPLSLEGEKWVLENFWPEEDEVSPYHNENMLQAWVNFYTALNCARTMSEVRAMEKQKGGAS
jgi:hypothetical protein